MFRFEFSWFQELAEAIDGMASLGEANLLRITGGLVPSLPGMNGPVNTRRMDEISMMLETFRDAIIVQRDNNMNNNPDTTTDGNAPNRAWSPMELARTETVLELVRAVSSFVRETRQRQDAEPLLAELQSVIRMVAVEILEIRGSRAMRSILQQRAAS